MHVLKILCAVSLALVACTEAPVVELGLSNAPSIQQKTQPHNHHDVISNGRDTCERTDAGRDPNVDGTTNCSGFREGALPTR